MGACSRGGRLFNNFTFRMDAYSGGRLFEGVLVRGITVMLFYNESVCL